MGAVTFNKRGNTQFITKLIWTWLCKLVIFASTALIYFSRPQWLKPEPTFSKTNMVVFVQFLLSLFNILFEPQKIQFKPYIVQLISFRKFYEKLAITRV